MTKEIAITGMAITAFCAHAFGGPPNAVVNDLSHLQVRRIFTTVHSMPRELQRALAKTFDQPKLWMASPNEAMNEMRGIYIGLPNEKAPERRLIFAFETDRFFYVYYEEAHAWSAACVIFPKSSGNNKPLLWGGADIRMPPYERAPEGLRNRILKNRLDDSKNFFW
jgi:hypothetical protein